MILLVIIFSLLILGATIYQYNNQSNDYNERRLERKENQVKNHINFILKRDFHFSFNLTSSHFLGTSGNASS